MAKNALLEIGTEEIPASYLEPARQQIKTAAEEFFTAHRLSFGAVTTYATPRRLALYIEQLAEKGEDRVEEITGPAAKAGKDAQGNFTVAAQGFAAKHGIAPEKLTVKTTEKGEYLCVTKKIPGEKADKLLVQFFPEIIGKIYFPKTMKWEESAFRFARPIRSIIALFGEKVIRFSIAGVKAGNWTIGLHTLSDKKIVIESAEKYAVTLRNSCVIADPKERREVLEGIIDETAKRGEGTALKDEGLVSEVNYLVEHPVGVLAHFDKKYLALPPEVLITCLKKKQKCFAMNDAQGKLSNAFVGIRNGISENQDVVREGYERVLTARLADAEFFFKQDTRTQLSAKSEKLKGVVFQQKLGTVHEKVGRVETLALFIREQLSGKVSLSAEADEIKKVSALAKADLVTEMVFEYPELQGAVGRIYAAHDGEPEKVSTAIEQHYWPLTAEGTLPDNDVAALISIADKMDTLAGDFAVGLVPTGSADPYGLRRMAAGVIRIVRERKLPLTLRALSEKAFSLLPEHVRENTKTVDQLAEFFRQRLENLLAAEGYRFDEIRAVLAAGADDITDIDRRLEALKQIRSLPDFQPLAAAFKRATNILRQAEKQKITVPSSVREDLLKEDAEKNLYADINRIANEVQQLIDRKEYLPALQRMVSLKPGVDEFFNKVMVMAEDTALRDNRLATLGYATRLFFRMIDFSQLQG